MLSVLDLFRVGIGPSSSHTVGPMRIALRFRNAVERKVDLKNVFRITVTLQGSLALTGEGHGTPKAIIFGLLGHRPQSIDIDLAEQQVADVHANKVLPLADGIELKFDPERDIILDRETQPDLHPNAMSLRAIGSDGQTILETAYYSTGGGFISTRAQLLSPAKGDVILTPGSVPLGFTSAAELLGHCASRNAQIHEVVYANEDTKRSRHDTDRRLDQIAEVMSACIDRGLTREGTLPGGLKVTRRAPDMWKKLQRTLQSNEREQLLDWLSVYAMAVNEENAAGGQVVTAPTNGAAGILPSILRHYCMAEGAKPNACRVFLLTAGGIGLLYKMRASISGAEMGCQGEVGVACSMAAAGLTAVWGGTPDQVTMAAEIGMEHNLGLTCDPVGGLVQIPCIERNAFGAVKAVNAARLALNSVGPAKVSLDQVIETMRQTGLDMSSKYKETSKGGLAVNVVEC